RPVRYLLSRYLGRGRGRLSLGPLGFIALDEVEPPPLPGPDWVRVKPELSGICGSDLAAVTAGDSLMLEPFQTYPFTFGHENIGRLAELGPAVTGWSPGDRVAVRPMLACEQRGIRPPCAACARGEYGLCVRTTEGALSPGFMIGYCRDTGGGWSGSFVAHRSQLLRLPGALPDDVAVLLDPFASALRPVLLHPPRPHDRVLVIGAGSIGILTVRALRLAGWSDEITVLGRYPFQNERAEAAGATRILTSREQLFRWAGSLPGAKCYDPTLAPRFVEGGPSLIYDTVAGEGTLADALALAGAGGRIVVVGTAARMTADWTRLVIRNLEVAGVFAYGPVPAGDGVRDVYEIALDWMRADGFAALDMVTHAYALEEYRAAIAAALDKNGHGSIKVVFKPGD
ncbi:MAG: zinc-dependent alcohol dehydrogenase, partial [Longimicrobiales bacterium]